MKKLHVVQAIGVLLLLCLAFWKNTFSYSAKSKTWRTVKSLIDCTIVCLSALFFPPLLVGWAVMWLIRHVHTRSIQVSLAIAFGVVFGVVSGVALEILCIVGIFSVDLLTGAQGIYGWFKQDIPLDFLPNLRKDEIG